MKGVGRSCGGDAGGGVEIAADGGDVDGCVGEEVVGWWW